MISVTFGLIDVYLFQKPLVIYPHLPKLVEAVVKSLDPNSTANRDAVLDTATEILGHVVKTCAPLAPLTFESTG